MCIYENDHKELQMSINSIKTKICICMYVCIIYIYNLYTPPIPYSLYIYEIYIHI